LAESGIARSTKPSPWALMHRAQGPPIIFGSGAMNWAALTVGMAAYLCTARMLSTKTCVLLPGSMTATVAILVRSGPARTDIGIAIVSSRINVMLPKLGGDLKIGLLGRAAPYWVQSAEAVTLAVSMSVTLIWGSEAAAIVAALVGSNHLRR
jgi:hypothetical protein